MSPPAASAQGEDPPPLVGELDPLGARAIVHIGDDDEREELGLEVVENSGPNVVLVDAGRLGDGQPGSAAAAGRDRLQHDHTRGVSSDTGGRGPLPMGKRQNRELPEVNSQHRSSLQAAAELDTSVSGQAQGHGIVAHQIILERMILDLSIIRSIDDPISDHLHRTARRRPGTNRCHSRPHRATVAAPGTRELDRRAPVATSHHGARASNAGPVSSVVAVAHDVDDVPVRGRRTKNRRTPHGSVVSGWTIS